MQLRPLNIKVTCMTICNPRIWKRGWVNGGWMSPSSCDSVSVGLVVELRVSRSDMHRDSEREGEIWGHTQGQSYAEAWKRLRCTKTGTYKCKCGLNIHWLYTCSLPQFRIKVKLKWKYENHVILLNSWRCSTCLLAHLMMLFLYYHASQTLFICEI